MDGKNNIEELISKLNNKKNKQACIRAAGILGELKNPRALEPLIAIIIEDYDYEVTESAKKALAQLGDMALEDILKALQGGLYGRWKLIDFLKRTGDPSAAEALVSIVNNFNHPNDYEVKDHALRALGEMEGRLVLDTLIGQIESNGNLNETALRALERTPDVRMIEPLITAYRKSIQLRNPNDTIARSCIVGIFHTCMQHQLIEKMSESQRHQTIEGLSAIYRETYNSDRPFVVLALEEIIKFKELSAAERSQIENILSDWAKIKLEFAQKNLYSPLPGTNDW